MPICIALTWTKDFSTLHAVDESASQVTQEFWGKNMEAVPKSPSLNLLTDDNLVAWARVVCRTFINPTGHTYILGSMSAYIPANL